MSQKNEKWPEQPKNESVKPEPEMEQVIKKSPQFTPPHIRRPLMPDNDFFMGTVYGPPPPDSNSRKGKS